MSINKTTTDLSTLKINYLTQEMYENALENDEINENELYVTPGREGGGGTSNTLLYGVCDTNANTAAKTATINSSFELVEGATIAIKFTNANTVANPTLNINNTGAKAIKRYGTTNAGVLEHTSWSKGEVVPLLYDGTYWQIMYNMTQNNYVTQTYSTNNNNYNLALSSYTNATIGVSDLNHSTKIKGNPSTGRITTEDMTSQEVEDFVDGLDISGGGILDMFYPVGSYYETSDTTFNPNTVWGGTWTLVTKDSVTFNSGNYITIPAYTETKICTINLDAGKRYLLIGTAGAGEATSAVSSSNMGVQSGTYNYFYNCGVNSATASAGRTLSVMAYIETNTACVAFISKYNYGSSAISTAWGHIVAIPLINLQDGNYKWHRTA